MRSSTIFDNAQPPCRNLIVDAMIQENDAIGYVFFQTLSGKRAVASLTRADGCYALILQPVKEAPYSARRIAGLAKAENRLSIVSRTTRLAPIWSIANSKRRNRPSRS